MKTYTVKIIEEENGKKYLAINGLILSNELKAIKNKLGDINKYPTNYPMKLKISKEELSKITNKGVDKYTH